MFRFIVNITVVLLINFKLCTPIGINCNFGIQWFDFVGNTYQCSGSILNDGQDTDTVTTVNGTHQIEKSNSDVVALRMNNQNLRFFPVNIEEYFPNIKVITFYGNSISEVKNSHLAPFPNLVYLNLYTNKITSLDGNLLDGLQSLQYVSFERNNIVHVGHDLALPKAGNVYFDANPCINMRAFTVDDIAVLRFNLLINCTLIKPIENALESRRNFITNLNDRVQTLAGRMDSLEQSQSKVKDDVEAAVNYFNSRVESLTNQVMNVNGQVQSFTNEIRNVIGNVEQRISQMDYAINNIMTLVGDLFDRNAQLEEKLTVYEGRVECLRGIAQGQCE